MIQDIAGKRRGMVRRMPLHHVTEEQARPPVQGPRKLRPLGSWTVLLAPRSVSHRPVLVPRNRRALSMDPWRGRHSSVDQHGRQVGSAARAPTHLLPRRTRSDRHRLKLWRRETPAAVLQLEGDPECEFGDESFLATEVTDPDEYDTSLRAGRAGLRRLPRLSRQDRANWVSDPRLPLQPALGGICAQ